MYMYSICSIYTLFCILQRTSQKSVFHSFRRPRQPPAPRRYSRPSCPGRAAAHPRVGTGAFRDSRRASRTETPERVFFFHSVCVLAEAKCCELVAVFFCYPVAFRYVCPGSRKSVLTLSASVGKKVALPFFPHFR